ncbi:hypothetical protein JIG36_19530 [Actinoplanes sp. LDG1-06]|uniref:Uncharacterized protein n=1 Tax=Paractinoplanes ovalisporus TaxID=2810368 RepID=A0ABS2AD46_9ACTN|nr:hypothetical protein [Actinoplanes ovalisporus]MBM2617752.1 hypothetical protein [Actinoplanes ovalisporus]
MRLVHGLGQALAVWVAVLLVVLLVPRLAVLWVSLGIGLVSVILLGQWHRRRSRPDAAVGAFAGAVLWPVLIGAALIAINIVSSSMSAYE